MNKRWPPLVDLPRHAKSIVEALRANGFPEDGAQRSVMHLASEVGEFVGSFLRHTGQARRKGTPEETLEELADVVITAYIAAEEMGDDLNFAIHNKLLKVYTRGWRE